MDSSPSSSSQSPFSVMAAKIFVGGITKDLEENVLKEYFEKYGVVKEVVVPREKATGNVKGYGFVEFIDSEAAVRALNDEAQHVILNRTVHVNRARSRSEEKSICQSSCHGNQDQNTVNFNNKENVIASKKIFVGGLSSSITVDEFRSYFQKFGTVNDFVIMYDKVTRRPRGFGFVTFDLEEAAMAAVQMRFHELNNKRIEVKIAVPRACHDTSGSINNRGISNCNTPWAMLNSSIRYHPWVYPSYDPKYGYCYSHASQHVSGYGFGLVDYEGGYAYSATGCGAVYACPSLTLNELTIRQIPVPYCDPSSYTGYVNVEPGAYMKMVNGVFNGAVWLGKGKLCQTCNLQSIKPKPASKVSLEVENVEVDGAH